MTNQEIDELLSVTDDYCVSVIVPTHRFPEGKLQDELQSGKAIDHAKELLKHFPGAPATLAKKLDELFDEISFSHTKDGIGIFVSREITRLVDFPFPVIEKVSIGASFECRELLFYKNLPEYLVLSLSQKTIRLYKGKGEEVKEMQNEDFPRHYKESYEYEHPSVASSSSYSLKAVEKDKSVLKDTRLRTFLRSADRVLGKYLQNGTPVILSGVTKELAEYKQLSKFRQNIVGTVLPSHSYNKKEFSDAVWELVQSYNKSQNTILLNKLRELTGRGSAVFGLSRTFDAAQEGKGLMLLIEKDLQAGTYDEPHRKSNSWHSSAASAQASTHYNEVDEIIRMVIDKKGRVVFIDNSTLADLGGIALILRYNGYPLV